MPAIHNPIFFKYLLECTHPGCTGKLEIEYPQNGGWALGGLVPEDPSHPEVGRCSKCKRYKMKVVRVPDPPAPMKPVGWNKVPTK